MCIRDRGLASVATIALNVAAGVYGDAAIAGMSIVSRIAMFANSALIGFGQGFQPVCGFNYGAKLYHRVREAFYFCVRYSAVFLCAVSIAGSVSYTHLDVYKRQGRGGRGWPRKYAICHGWPGICRYRRQSGSEC